jgi:hypothetical protein
VDTQSEEDKVDDKIKINKDEDFSKIKTDFWVKKTQENRVVSSKIPVVEKSIIASSVPKVPVQLNQNVLQPQINSNSSNISKKKNKKNKKNKKR